MEGKIVRPLHCNDRKLTRRRYRPSAPFRSRPLLPALLPFLVEAKSLRTKYTFRPHSTAQWPLSVFLQPLLRCKTTTSVTRWRPIHTDRRTQPTHSLSLYFLFPSSPPPPLSAHQSDLHLFSLPLSRPRVIHCRDFKEVSTRSTLLWGRDEVGFGGVPLWSGGGRQGRAGRDAAD